MEKKGGGGIVPVPNTHAGLPWRDVYMSRRSKYGGVGSTDFGGEGAVRKEIATVSINQNKKRFIRLSKLSEYLVNK